jgi:hypothetical protein
MDETDASGGEGQDYGCEVNQAHWRPPVRICHWVANGAFKVELRGNSP